MSVAQPGNVLVVDDNPLVVGVLKSLLSTEQLHVLTSSNGAEALDVLRHEPVDVILCDVMMPKMNGYELHDAVRSKAEYAHIPFIFLTALGAPEDIHLGKDMGADDYLPKPFDPQILLATVRGKLKRARSLRSLGEEQNEIFRKRVIHTLSHEFRTPLVAITTGTELLLHQQLPELERVQKLLDAIHRGGLRLERLINDFMLLQQIEAGIAERLFENRSTVLPFSSIVQQFVEEQRPVLVGQNFTVSFVDHSEHAATRLYEPHIRDILQRLVSNVIKFSPRERVIEFVVFRLEGNVVLEVRDRGIGLDPRRAMEAINAFSQLDRDQLEQQGGGLGLAIAHRYAAIHGGRLEFEARDGGGSIVSLSLPC